MCFVAVAGSDTEIPASHCKTEVSFPRSAAVLTVTKGEGRKYSEQKKIPCTNVMTIFQVEEEIFLCIYGSTALASEM